MSITTEYKYNHFCPEWDYLEISIDNPEIMACICFDDENFIKARDGWFDLFGNGEDYYNDEI